MEAEVAVAVVGPTVDLAQPAQLEEPGVCTVVAGAESNGIMVANSAVQAEMEQFKYYGTVARIRQV
jgi:hypothetical protein